MKILDEIEESLKKKFAEIYAVKYNSTTKGKGYEETVKVFLERYLGNFFNFFVRVPIYDWELKCKELLSDSENEFDVVATYKTSLPRMVFEIMETPFISYDTVAFVAEVKQTLTKPNLERDLEKLAALAEFSLGSSARLSAINTQYSLIRPLRILFYYEKQIDDKLLWETVSKAQETVDFLVILSENKVFLNGHLPITKKVVKDLGYPEGKSAFEQRYPFLKLMYYVTLSLQYPLITNAWEIFENLFSK